MMKIVDTDVLIDHFHGHQAALDFIVESLANADTLALSVVSVSEILSGMRPGEEARTERLFRMFAILDVNEAIARAAGAYLREFRRTHQLELGDALIAATAQVHRAEVVTRNAKHYPMPDVRVTAPYERGRV